MRTKKILMSSLAEVIPYLILGIIGFIKVRVIIDNLGSDLNGYYQFINQIIAYLFLIESGFGRAVIFHLYKPFANNDEKAISEVFNGSRKIFRYFGFAIFGLVVLSLIVIPFVFDVKATYQLPVLLSFLIISMAYLIAYFGKENSYYALFCADQKKYVYSLIFNGLKIVDDIIIIFVAIYFQSLIGIALTIFIIKVIEEITMRYFGRKHFPFVHKTKKIDTTSFKMTKDLVWHQLSFLISNNADIIILLYFINPVVVSIYTTYSFISRFLNEITTRINNVVSYSFGNKFANEKEEDRNYQLNDEYFILAVLMAFTISLPFVWGIRPFVGVWIDNITYQIAFIPVVLFGFNLFLWTVYSPLVAVINAKGLYKESKYVVSITAILNVVLSIIFIKSYQNPSISESITAVLSATAIASIINIVWRGFVTKKYVFPKVSIYKTIFPYILSMITFIIVVYLGRPIEKILFSYENSIILTVLLIILLAIITLIITAIILSIIKPNTKLLISRVKPFLGKHHEKV